MSCLVRGIDITDRGQSLSALNSLRDAIDLELGELEALMLSCTIAEVVRLEHVAKSKIQEIGLITAEIRKRTRGFYSTRAWLDLRYKVLVKHGGRCQCCGVDAARGAILNVDHIKPRSLYPELELEESNLQVLCADCNRGKSNKDETDFRPALASALAKESTK